MMMGRGAMAGRRCTLRKRVGKALRAQASDRYSFALPPHRWPGIVDPSINAGGTRRLPIMPTMADAVRHYNQGDRAAARAACEQILASGSKDNDARLLLAILLIEDGDAGRGLSLLELIVASAPNNARARHALGQALARLGRSGEAVTHLEQVIAQQPLNIDAYLDLGGIHLRCQQAPAAERVLRQALAAAPQHPAVLSNLGGLLAANGAAEGIGLLLVRMATLGVPGFFLAWTLSGGWPTDPRGLLLAVPLGILAGSVCVVFQTVIGITAFWLQDASPVYWIWQKLMFVFGGLILPLDAYPEWLREIAAWTPFHALVYGPARTTLGFDPAAAGRTALEIAAWGGIGLFVLLWTFRRGLRALDVNGG
jgi:tetratricopeptide (TPR) repeat protein